MFARVANVGKANALQISEGFHLFLTFNSRKLITVDDQVIKCFIADDLTAPAITSIGHQHTQKLTTIGGMNVVTGSDDNTSCLFSLEMGELVSTLMQSSLPIRHVALMSKYAAIVSDDLDIKLVDIADITNIRILSGHSHAIIHIAFDDAGDYLLSASVNGAVLIWDLTTNQPTLTKRLDGMIDKHLATKWNVSWNAEKGMLAFPGKDKQILVMEKDSWQILYIIKHASLHEVKCVRWSPDGRLLAALDSKEQILVWEPSTSRTKIVAKQNCPSIFTSFDWIDNTKLVAIDSSGYVYEGAVKMLQEKHRAASPESKLDSMFDDEVPALPADECSVSDEHAESDFIEDDDGGGYKQELLTDKDFKSYQDKQRQMYASKKSRKSEVVEQFAVHEIQASFQSGSAPYRGTKRYLAFNMDGLIYTIDQSSYSTVSVEFHDRSRRPLTFTDNYNFSIGYLGVTGALFTSEATTDVAGMISYRSFDAGSKTDWMAQLDASESVKAIAVTKTYAIVGTDNRYLRVFTLSGVQVNIICVEGPIVCMSAHNDTVAVVYHRGGTFHGDQNLECVMIDMLSHAPILKVSVPISPASILKWIGFNDNGSMCTFDSSGVLRALNGASWIPLLDTRKNKVDQLDSYWVVGLTETSLMCVICRGGEQYPPFPKPLLHELALQIPLLNLENNQGQVEEKRIRAKIAFDLAANAATFETERQKMSIDMDKLTLQLIHIACKNEKLDRAFDLCETLKLTRSLDGALKLAVHSNLTSLAERINGIKEQKYLEEKNKKAAVNQSQQRRIAETVPYSRSIEQYERDHPIDVDALPEPAPTLQPAPHIEPEFPKARKTVNFSFNDSTEPHPIEMLQPKSKAFANPFAKPIQSSSIPIETRVDTNPLEAVDMLMMKKPVVVSNFNAKRKAQTTLFKSGVVRSDTAEKKQKEAKNDEKENKNTEKESTEKSSKSLMDRFKMKEAVEQVEDNGMDLDGEPLESESLRSIVEKVQKVRATSDDESGIDSD